MEGAHVVDRCINSRQLWLSRCVPAWQRVQEGYEKSVRCFQPCHDPEVRSAIKRNDPAALASLLDRPRCLGLTSNNIDVPLDGADGNALHMAAATASEALVSALLERGAVVHLHLEVLRPCPGTSTATSLLLVERVAQAHEDEHGAAD